MIKNLYVFSLLGKWILLMSVSFSCRALLFVLAHIVRKYTSSNQLVVSEKFPQTS